MDELLRRIEQRQAVVGVIGLGYVGLPLAVEFAQAEAQPILVRQRCWCCLFLRAPAWLREATYFLRYRPSASIPATRTICFAIRQRPSGVLLRNYHICPFR